MMGLLEAFVMLISLSSINRALNRDLQQLVPGI